MYAAAPKSHSTCIHHRLELCDGALQQLESFQQAGTCVQCRHSSESWEAVGALARHIILKTPDKADLRLIATDAAASVMSQLPIMHQHQFVLFIARLARTPKVCSFCSCNVCQVRCLLLYRRSYRSPHVSNSVPVVDQVTCKGCSRHSSTVHLLAVTPKASATSAVPVPQQPPHVTTRRMQWQVAVSGILYYLLPLGDTVATPA